MGNPTPTAPPVSDIDVTMLSPPPYSQIDTNTPSNNGIIEDQSLTGPPPSYFEIFGEIRQVEDPKGFFTYVGKVFRVIVNTLLVTILLSLFNIVPISMIIIGSLNIGNCRIEKYIPIWLICFGVTLLLRSVLQLVIKKLYGPNVLTAINESNSSVLYTLSLIGKILNLASLIFFIWGLQMISANIGSVNFFKKDGKKYCDHLTFILSTVIVFFIAAILALFFCFMVCCCGCLCFLNIGNRRNRR
uniref:G_PROTEIN_RECEP_F1_2 domain-containing protein n=1 Tax=Strongyloides papillosus TaxID=174720 RepID=A0A0N5B2G0_STREA